MFKKITTHLMLATALLCTNSALANDIRILNRNFDSDAIPPNPGYLTHISGWVKSGFGNIGVKAPQSGVHYNDIGHHGLVGFLEEGARLTQTADTLLQNGETYTLTFEAGKPLGSLGQDFIVRFKADGLALAQQQFDSTSVPLGDWATHSFSFTATSDMPVGKPLVVEFQNSATTSGYELNIDNVYLEGAGTGDPLPPKVEGNNGLIMVGVNLTLKVPEVFADINAALNYMEDKFIKVGKTVTIKVSDCTNQNFTQPIVVDHPNGDSIHIVGKSTSPSDCVLNFNGSSGFIVKNNRSLGLLDGFHINGTEAPSSSGVYADMGASIHLGENLWVSNFATGIYANELSRIFADKVTSFGNSGNGFYASFNSIIRAEEAHSYDNGSSGYSTYHNGLLFADYARASNNTHNGFLASNHSFLRADHATATNSAQGFYAHNMGGVSARFASSSSSSTDYYSFYLSFLDRIGSSGNSFSPGIGSESNSGSFLK